MLTVLLVWLITAFVTTTLGVAAFRIARRCGIAGADHLPAPEWLSLVGLALITALLQIWSLVAAIDGWAQTAVGLGAVALLGLHWRPVLALWRAQWPTRWDVPAKAGSFLLLLLLGWLLMFGAQLPINYDVGLYQLQTLQWTERYPAVPGLGNLHGRLAFNSGLYLPMALLRLHTPHGPAYGLSSYLYPLLAVVVVRALVTAMRNPEADARRVWVPLLLFLLLMFNFQVWLSSVTADCTTAALLALTLLWYSLHPPAKATEAQRLLLLLLAALAVSFKLSALPILLLPLYATWVHRAEDRWPRTWLLPLGLGLLLGLPWLARNVVLSGYLIYPLPFVDVFDVDWKLPYEYARMEHSMVVNLARNSAQSPYALPRQTLWEWLPNWWAPLRGFWGVMVILALGSPLVAAWRWRHPRTPDEEGWAGAWLVAWLGCIFWFVAGPDFRFGAGFIISAAVWPWAGPRWLGPAQRGAIAYLPWALFTIWVMHNLRDHLYFVRTQPMRFAQRIVLPELPPVPATVQLPIAPGLQVRVPRTGHQCWGAELPCVHCVEEGLELRGATLAEGFRRRYPAPAGK
ncbi:LIC_10190 family membrane protein [Solirubrum puertoriconensis]|nr:hypothetical protein [Solirubrum puertoriconensis]